MKRFLAGMLLISIFSAGIFISIAADVGPKSHTELVKFHPDLAVPETAWMELAKPVQRSRAYLPASVINEIERCRPVVAVAHAPPAPIKELLQNSQTQSNRIRAVTG